MNTFTFTAQKGVHFCDDFWAALCSLKDQLGGPEWVKEYRQNRTRTREI